MATENTEKNGGQQIDFTKTTVEQKVPALSEQDINYINKLNKKIDGIDLSDESLMSSPSILNLTMLGKKNTDYYNEQRKRHQKAGKFAAWSQFANALASFLGGAAAGQAMPIQQNYNIPLSSFQKADAYRDAVMQNDERYNTAIEAAKQNERTRRLGYLNSLIEQRQKLYENAYKNGTTVKRETDPLGTMKALSQMENDAIRAQAAKTNADAASRRANSYDDYTKSKISGNEKKRLFTPIDTIPDTVEYGSIAGKHITGVMISSIVDTIKHLAQEDKEFAKELAKDNEFEQRLSIAINPSDITKQDVTWLRKYLRRFPERFAYIFNDPNMYEYGGKQSASDNDGNSDNELLESIIGE